MAKRNLNTAGAISLENLALDVANFEKEVQVMRAKTAEGYKKAFLAGEEAVLRQQKANLELIRRTAIETANTERNARLAALNEVYSEELKLAQSVTAARAEGIEREKRAELRAQNELQDLRVKHEEQLTELAKQRALMSGQNLKEYTALLRQNKNTQKQIEANARWLESLADAGVDPDSKRGQQMRKQQENADAHRAGEEYAKNVISQLPLLGVKFGETSVNGWSWALRDMVNGQRKGNDGLSHSISTDRDRLKDARNAQSFKRLDLEKAAKASGDADAYMQRYDAARNSLLKWDTNTGKTAYTMAQEKLAGLRGDRGGAESRLNALKEQQAGIDAALDSKDLTGEERKELQAQKDSLDSQIKDAEGEVSTITEAINQALADSGLDQLDETQLAMLEADNNAEVADKNLKKSIFTSIANTTKVLSNLAESLESMSDTIAGYQSQIDTRLYGSTENGQQRTATGWSYWKQISYDLSATMMSPLIKEETLMNNVITAVEKGISKDVTQVAMLETISDKIATTFNAFDGTMRRLIRIQDTNTTAARLGMEASLNELLNEMYETTEYLSDLATSVKNNLEEAEALMGGEDAVEFEYQVQKWLGSLYSVGMSSSGISSIATALGQLASGDISGITSGGASNLLIMAANNAGLSISDILADGLDSSDTNKLLSAMVEYMAELVSESNDSLVVQQQLAEVYGLTASDLRAATNLTGTYNGKTGYMNALSSYTGSYNSMLSNLVDMANSMYSRTSLGELMSNVWSNVQYSTASGMTNIASTITMKLADIFDTFASGIPIGYLSYLGTGYDTKLTVSDILKTGSIVGGFTSSLVSLISSIANGGDGGFTGEGLLKLVGINTSGTSTGGSNTSKSGSATIYNSDVGDITDSATSSADDESTSTIAEAQEESTEVTNATINENIVNIYNLLQSVVDGTASLNIRASEVITVTESTSGILPGLG